MAATKRRQVRPAVRALIGRLQVPLRQLGGDAEAAGDPPQVRACRSMTDFLVKRDDLRECRIAESEPPELGAGPGAAAGRQLRADRQQRHLRGDGRGDVLLGLLPRRGRLGTGADVGLRRGRAQRGRGGRGGDAGLRVPAALLPPGGRRRPAPTSGGFVDGSPHRAALPSAYHRYLATERRPLLPGRHRGRSRCCCGRSSSPRS